MLKMHLIAVLTYFLFGSSLGKYPEPPKNFQIRPNP